MKFTSSKGETYDFHLDLGAILEMEKEDPTFSVITLADRISDNLRFTDLVMLAKILGWDLTDFIARGFAVTELTTILMACMQEWGFISEQDAPSS